MNDLIPALRGRPGSTAVHVRHELAGLVLHDLPVPALADGVLVEVRLRLPPTARQKTDYTLRIPGHEPCLPESLRRDESEPHRYRLTFRLAVPTFSTRAELLWRNKLLADLAIPIRSNEEFLNQLTFGPATTTIQIADRSVAAQTFVATQCRGFTTALVLRSPTALAPLATLGMRVIVRSERTAFEQTLPVSFSSSQLAAKEAILTATLAKPPRRTGTYSVTWFAGDRELLTSRIQAISGKEFLQSLRLSDARFAVTDKAGTVRFHRHAPPLTTESTRIGPCFVICSKLSGMAGWISLKAVALPASDPALELDGGLMITDGPSVFAPGMVESALTANCTSFELRTKSHTLGTLSLHPVPTASFNAEGGFKPPPEFVWTPTAEDELAERLAKLMREA